MVDNRIFELRAAAMKATQGEWRIGHAHNELKANKYQVITDFAGGVCVLLEANYNFPDDAEANIAFVTTANPTTILALCDEIDRLKQALARGVVA